MNLDHKIQLNDDDYFLRRFYLKELSFVNKIILLASKV